MNKEYILTQSAPQIQYLANADPNLGLLIKTVGEISYTLSDDPFSFLVNTIVCQMLSKKVADVISARLLEKCKGSLTVSAVSKLAAEDLRAVGLSGSKAKYIFNLADAASRIGFNNLVDLSDAEVIQSLTSIKGIGVWSAKMYLIFVLGREDVLPYEDVAFLQSYYWMYSAQNEKKAEVEKRCAAWKPYSTIAARYLYMALDTGLTKKPFPEIVLINPRTI